MAHFEFDLQDALEQAERAQRGAESDVADARQAVRQAEQRVAEIQNAQREIEQQIARAGDEYGRVAAHALSDARRHWRRWTALRARLLAVHRGAALEVRYMQHRLRLRQLELGWACNKVESFKRLRERAHRAFRAEQQRRADGVQEELANIRSARALAEDLS